MFGVSANLGFDIPARSTTMSPSSGSELAFARMRVVREARIMMCHRQVTLAGLMLFCHCRSRRRLDMPDIDPKVVQS
jgi:hypothetical protein